MSNPTNPSEEIDEMPNTADQSEEMSDESDLSEETDNISDTTDQSVSGQSDLSEGTRQTWQQGGVVYRQFSGLMDKCRAEPMSIQESASIDRVESKKDFLNQLHSTLLPLLQQHIIKLASEFKLDMLWGDRDAKFKTLLENQSELNHILDQINYAKYSICPAKSEPDASTCDQNLKEFKTYRISILREKLNSLLSQLELTFQFCRYLLEELPTSEYSMYCSDVFFLKRCFASGTSECCNTIDSTIRWMNRSDFYLIRDQWPDWIYTINEKFDEFMKLSGSDLISPNQKLRHKLLKLAKLAIPVIKLCRIFFSKLSKQVLSMTWLPLFTELSSQQIKTLRILPGYINSHLKNFLLGLKQTTNNNRATSASSLLMSAQEHSKDFQISVDLITSHIVPILPKTDDFPSQDYFRNWLGTWNTEHLVATENLVQAVKLIGRIE
ncbi:hypothetical protein PGT21_009903 [Puccinia graminis f. sp. tritici]|uniref:Uncharacterized protein n=1 Tax=Puccinia graminis f. sp. tritici TaxID=56615 RepID=A0A5B0SEN6_PUCGR|nr:hypothetical protein PGT21_009903 [Puccinia graminis f. sp. tritici]KAA1135939.1 hypothetical protein PGTUg99_004440 [Puccinia graminis f. sp. tritici]